MSAFAVTLCAARYFHQERKLLRGKVPQDIPINHRPQIVRIADKGILIPLRQ